jgi:class 3 adenylate cyclase
MTPNAVTGTVTLLFTDLVDSTGVLQRLGEEGAEQFRRTHFRLLREAVAAHGGEEVKSLGDGLMVAFGSALAATRCAIAMQQAVELHNRRGGEPLNVRAGLHVGEPIRDEEDYFGTPVVIAKRLCDRAEGRQVLASDLVRTLIGARSGLSFRDLGLLALKGLKEPVAACEVVWEPAVEEPPPLLPLPASLVSGERTPFVGRKSDLERLLAFWGKARSNQRQLILLSGEPGIGKTRLATEFALATHAEGASVLLGRCDEELALPYMPFVEALRQYFGSQPSGGSESAAPAWGEALAHLMPEARRASSPELTPFHLDPEQERFRLYDAVDRAVMEIAGGEPLVLLLDDLHWADKASLLLLRHLLRSPAPAPILFVGTYRETDLARTHPLAEMLGDFRRAPSFLHVHIGGLSADNTASLIDAWAGHGTPANFAEAVHAATEGNPFFIQEVLRHLTEATVFVPQEDGWVTAVTIEDMGIPEGIREVIGRRLSNLSEDTNAALLSASVFGRDFDLDPLERVTGLTAERLLLALEEARAAGLIDEGGAAGSYRFGHALVREALYAELSATRRARLHGRIADVLEASYGRQAEGNAARLANHYLEAGMLSRANVSKAEVYSKLAAEQAEAATAWAEAARHYESCLSLITASDEDLGEDEAALLVALGRCLRYDARSQAAWLVLMRATTIYRERGDGAGMARAALEASASAVLAAAREQFVTLAEQALNVLGDSDPRLRAHLLFMRAGDDFDDASKVTAGEAETIAQTLDDPALLGRLAYRQATRAALEMRIDEAVSLFQRAHALFDEGGERQRAAHSLGWAAVWILVEGKLDDGAVAVKNALAYDRKFHVRFAELWCLAARQAVALIRCDFRQFDSLMEEASGASEAAEASHFLAVVCAAKPELGGDTDGALKLVPTPDERVGAGLLGHLLGSLARTTFNAGREDQAREYLEEWSRELSQMSPWLVVFRLYAIAELDECLPALGDEALVRSVYDELTEWKSLRYSPPDARGLDHIRGALALRLERVDDAETWYRTGLEWAKRERCPVEQGRCLQGLAEVADRRHRKGEALRLLDEASVLFEAHGAKLYLDRAITARAALNGRRQPNGSGGLRVPARPDELI